jgi:hypothetical protein
MPGWTLARNIDDFVMRRRQLANPVVIVLDEEDTAIRADQDPFEVRDPFHPADVPDYNDVGP